MFQLYYLNRSGDDASAVCLDGSPGGFYFSPGWFGNVNKWLIHLEGGGWCYTPAQCYWRSLTQQTGSSKNWPQDALFPFGPMSSDPVVNPAFRTFNRVYVKYCDGGSFAGDTKMTYTSERADNITLHFRGRRVLLAVVQRLIAEFGLGADSGAEVLLSGCSAGGLAVLLNADVVRAALPHTVVRYKAVCGSGFFQARPSVDGVQVYQPQMKKVFLMQKLSHTLPSSCVSSQHSGHEWRCVLAATVSPFVKSPVFFLESIADTWQLGCIFNAQPIDDDRAEISYMEGCFRERENWGVCLGMDFDSAEISERCTPAQLGKVKAFGDDLLQDVLASGVEASAGNGAFITSCEGHCGITKQGWHEGQLAPLNLTGATEAEFHMHEAVYRWWLNDASVNESNSHQHVYLPCALNSKPPFQCNPTCPPAPGANNRFEQHRTVLPFLSSDHGGASAYITVMCLFSACVCFGGFGLLMWRCGEHRKYSPVASRPKIYGKGGRT